VLLSDAAARAGLSIFRASVIERDPRRARAGELERLRSAIDELSVHRPTRDELASEAFAGIVALAETESQKADQE